MKNNYGELTYKELLSKKEELCKKYFDLRVSKVTGHIESPIQKRLLRKDIARVNTYIQQYQLGMKE